MGDEVRNGLQFRIHVMFDDKNHSVDQERKSSMLMNKRENVLVLRSVLTVKDIERCVSS